MGDALLRDACSPGKVPRGRRITGFLSLAGDAAEPSLGADVKVEVRASPRILVAAGTAVILSCATQPGVRPPTSQDEGTGDAPPAACRETPRPLDADGTALLVALEQDLSRAVILSTAKDQDLELVGDLRTVLRQYPDVDLRFVFPSPVVLPASRFRAGTAARSEDLQPADHVVFYLEISDVGMVGPGGARGLVLHGGAGPTGRAPRGTVWMWGIWGRFCMLRGAHGQWLEYPIGPVAIS
jgi:hypothetical protein